MLGAVAAEVAQGGEIHDVGNLRQGQAGVAQIFLPDERCYTQGIPEEFIEITPPTKNNRHPC